MQRAPNRPGEATKKHACASSDASTRPRSASSTNNSCPIEASFDAFVPRYIAWLQERDAQGSVWRQGEQALEIQPPQLGGVVLHGVIDRVDEVREGAATVLELIDYKTGNADALRQKLKQPLEDTQLAFYAALMRGQGETPLRAIYLPLDGTKALVPLLHPER